MGYRRYELTDEQTPAVDHGYEVHSSTLLSIMDTKYIVAPCCQTICIYVIFRVWIPSLIKSYAPKLALYAETTLGTFFTGKLGLDKLP